MDVKKVGDAECIQCGACISACPTNAIQWNGSKFFLAPNAIGNADTENEEEKQKAEEAIRKAELL